MFCTLAGTESEFAVAGANDGSPDTRDALIARLFSALAARYPSLPAISRRGIYCANGCHFYPDCGKAEAATAESDNVYDVVRYHKAVEAMLAAAAQDIETRSPHREMFVFRGNCDYSGSEATWGSHESYQHVCDPPVLHAALVCHLVTRTVYAGCGGWRPWGGLEFTLSPRACHVDRLVSSDSTNGGRKGGRPILHTRDEPLSKGGYHRLHLILGDSLYSEKALALRYGTTQLLVALVDAGIGAPPGVELHNPVAALHAIASDPDCRTTVQLAAGGRLTAVELQRRHLEWVERHITRLPPWASRITRLWAEILGALERDPMSLSGTLDWPFRLSLYRGYAQRQGRSLDGIGQSVELVRRLQEALDRTAWRGRPASVDFLIGPHSPALKLAAHLTASMRLAGQSWRDLGEQSEWQRRFFELDVKLGRIGPKGLFPVLEKAGLMPDHRFIRPQDIDDACLNPPGPGTRSHLRGKAVREVAAHGSGGACEWDQVYDRGRNRVLDLSDPLARDAKWADSPHPAAPTGSTRSRGLFDTLRNLR